MSTNRFRAFPPEDEISAHFFFGLSGSGFPWPVIWARGPMPPYMFSQARAPHIFLVVTLLQTFQAPIPDIKTVTNAPRPREFSKA